MEKTRILFLCTGNSARSQMAEAILRKIADRHFSVFSAGLELTVINPYALRVLEEAGIDASGQYAKPLSIYTGEQFDYLITVCSQADEKCPFIPGMGVRIHWPFEDPAGYKGSDEEKTRKSREIRDQLQEKILSWLDEPGIEPRFISPD